MKGCIKQTPQTIHITLCCLLLENWLVFYCFKLYLFFKDAFFLPDPIAKTETKVNNKIRK